ncbi:MAG: PQQ-dependent sugar dehydrogenase [Archangium sp.]|nr:PQQ-dependent sugar dehydrogenase [Archangium sp.]
MLEELGRTGWKQGRWVGLLVTFSLVACKSDAPAHDIAHEAIPPEAPEAVSWEPGMMRLPPPHQRAPRTPPQPQPIERRAFPLATPALGGYSLAPAFAFDEVILPSAVDWPRVAGARPFELERFGRIYELGTNAAREVLDFTDLVAMRGEAGALGMALHPDFGDGTGPRAFVYVWYNAAGTPSQQRLARYTWDPVSRTFSPASELRLIAQVETRPLHNAGRMQFGPDGFLYFGNGDDLNTANHQRIDRALFGGIFRIDVDSRGGAISHPPPRQPTGATTQGYFIPNDNPFVGVPNAMEEYFALGLRNPYSLSFDRQTGALWAGDVGDTWREEVNLVTSGGNYEWPYREGEIVRAMTATTLGTAQPPKFTYSHAEMGDLTSILGGFIYRGTALPELVGQYVYTDWPSCRVWALSVNGASVTRTTLFENHLCNPTGITEGPDGELYLMFVGGLAKLVRDPSMSSVPRKLSETVLFDDVAALSPAPGLVPYEINSPLWSDGARKQRWISVPQGREVTVGDAGVLAFPVGSLLVKQLDLGARRVETRVLVVGSEDTYGVTYRWNQQGTDADLVLEPADATITAGTSWHFPGAGQCWSCHRAENRVLGFTGAQLRRDDQLQALASRGVFSPATVANMPPALPQPSDTTATLEQRATAYLAANCSGCHHAGASYLGGGDTWNASYGVPLEDRGLVGAPHHNGPMARALNLGSAPLIAPGNPAGSLLLARMKSINPDLRMPPLARNTVDAEGVALIEAWIASMPASP